MALWMVRAGQLGEHENFALDNSMVVVGWEEMGDLSDISAMEKMRKLCEEIYLDASKNKISNFVGQLWSFKDRIAIGDLVALPLKTQSAIALGKVTGDYKYVPNNPYGAKHTRTVKWVQTDTPRSNFGKDLLYSLGAFRTVCRVKRNNADERVSAILNGAIDPNLTAQPAAETDVEPEGVGIEPPSDIEQYSKDQIHAHIEAKFKGHDLTRLVTAILKAQGYKTEMASPGPDGGVDIIGGQGPMGFDPPRLCVQVKSGSGPSDVTILRELQGVMKNFGAQQGLLVSWGGFKTSAHKEARTLFFEVRLWDADMLIQNLIEYYNKLPDTIQAEIPLKRIWTLVLEETE